MPSHIIHLSIASDINKKINLNSDEILLGSIMPDLTVSGHYHSHYPDEKQIVKQTATPDLFVKVNRQFMDNPIFVGILIHLLTDKFYNSYFFDNYYVYDSNNNSIGLRINNQEVKFESSIIKNIKHHEFDEYDKYLLFNKPMLTFKNNNCVDKVIDYDNIQYDKTELIKYIKNYNKKIDKSRNLLFIKKILFFPKFKLSNIQEMNELYENCCKYILDYLKKNNI